MKQYWTGSILRVKPVTKTLQDLLRFTIDAVGERLLASSHICSTFLHPTVA